MHVPHHNFYVWRIILLAINVERNLKKKIIIIMDRKSIAICKSYHVYVPFLANVMWLIVYVNEIVDTTSLVCSIACCCFKKRCRENIIISSHKYRIFIIQSSIDYTKKKMTEEFTYECRYFVYKILKYDAT